MTPAYGQELAFALLSFVFGAGLCLFLCLWYAVLGACGAVPALSFRRLALALPVFPRLRLRKKKDRKRWGARRKNQRRRRKSDAASSSKQRVLCGNGKALCASSAPLKERAPSTAASEGKTKDTDKKEGKEKRKKRLPPHFFGLLCFDISSAALGGVSYLIFLYGTHEGLFRFYSLLAVLLSFFITYRLVGRRLLRLAVTVLSGVLGLFRFALLWLLYFLFRTARTLFLKCRGFFGFFLAFFLKKRYTIINSK